MRTIHAATAALAAAAFAVPAFAAPLVDFGFAGTGNIDESMPFSGGDTTVAAGVDLVSGLQIGPGLTALTANNRFEFNGVSDPDDIGTSSGVGSAIADDEFLTFTVGADSGSTLDLSGGSVVIENVAKQGNGGRAPDGLALASSVDGFSTILDSVSGLPFGLQTVTLDIPDDAAFSALTGPVELRVFTFRSAAPLNSDQGGGGFRLDAATSTADGVAAPGGVVLNGEVNGAPIPEPAAISALGLLGLAGLRRRR